MNVKIVLGVTDIVVTGLIPGQQVEVVAKVGKLVSPSSTYIEPESETEPAAPVLS